MPLVEVISIGSELILGRTLDTNAHWLSARLAEMGLPVTWRTTVGDDLTEVTAAFREAGARSDIVIATGGLGPTRDDVTRHALAAAAGVDLHLDAAVRDEIAALFDRWGRSMARRNEVQAMIPAGGEVIPNPHGTAPGIRLRVGRAEVSVMPGVPREMKAMFDDRLAPRLAPLGAGSAVVERLIRCFGAGESTIGERIHDLMDHDRHPRVGTTVSDGLITLRIVSRVKSRQEADDLFAATEAEIRRRLGDLVFGIDDDTLEAVVAAALKERSLTLAVAESCTGGLITDRLTDVPGISANLLEGVVAYSNAAKADILGVPPPLFETVGAVSEEVAAAMAEGVRRRAGADLGLSTTGIAGPTGGSDEKPVGLVYIGLADAAGATVNRHVLHGDRRRVKLRAALTALNTLRLHLISSDADWPQSHGDAEKTRPD